MLYQLWGGSFISSISKFLQPHLVIVYKVSVILRQSRFISSNQEHFSTLRWGFAISCGQSPHSVMICPLIHLQKIFCHKPSRTTKLQVGQVLLNNLVWNTWKTDKLTDQCACGSAIEWMTTFSLSILLFSLNWIVITHLIKSNVIRVFFFSQLRHAEQRISYLLTRRYSPALYDFCTKFARTNGGTHSKSPEISVLIGLSRACSRHHRKAPV